MRKDIAVYLVSKKYHVKGEVDEVLFLEDGTAAPLDYKFAEFRDTVFRTHKYQSALYGLMIADNYGVAVNRGFVCYTRSNHSVKEVELGNKDFERAIAMVKEVLDIIQKGFYPDATKYKARCVDCTYRNSYIIRNLIMDEYFNRKAIVLTYPTKILMDAQVGAMKRDIRKDGAEVAVWPEDQFVKDV